MNATSKALLLVAIRRSKYWPLCWIVVATLGYTQYRYNVAPDDTGWFLPFVLLLNALTAGPFVALSVAMWRLRKRARSLDFRMCPRCQYDLRALPDDGTCPECGMHYQRSETARASQPPKW